MDSKLITAGKETQRLSGLQRKLERHFITCSAALGTAAALAPSDAHATIQYFNPADIQITLNTYAGIYFNLQNGMIGTNAAAVPGWDINIFNQSAGFLSTYGPATTGMVGYTNGGFAYSDRIADGTVIGPASQLVGFGGVTTMSYGNAYGPWAGTTSGFLGLQFQLADGSLVFGWIRLDVVDGGDARVLDWAFEDSGAAIAAGAIPEPSSLALSFLAAGAAGLAYWRKRRGVKAEAA
ncbi:MAG: PEP-CTERM sorting domain-containing protein [Chthoniobacterales bacterium]